MTDIGRSTSSQTTFLSCCIEGILSITTLKESTVEIQHMAYLHNKHHNSKLAILMCQGNNTFIADYFKKERFVFLL